MVLLPATRLEPDTAEYLEGYIQVVVVEMQDFLESSDLDLEENS